MLAPERRVVCYDGEDWMCIDGTLYGPCGDDNCGGVCTHYGQCQCPGCEWENCCAARSKDLPRVP